ncbi:unnamed protein product [Larinioides sclopetarius]|uniref:Uncharacterized protein n=1 Tax=Larinioides sclopetarius TaxID=280406 RepID=A0AAV2AL19_9ARAC
MKISRWFTTFSRKFCLFIFTLSFVVPYIGQTLSLVAPCVNCEELHVKLGQTTLQKKQETFENKICPITEMDLNKSYHLVGEFQTLELEASRPINRQSKVGKHSASLRDKFT